MASPIRPPFTQETARAKVQAAEDAWNTRDPEKVALAYSENSQWRNHDEFFGGREAIKEFLRGSSCWPAEEDRSGAEVGSWAGGMPALQRSPGRAGGRSFDTI